MATITTEDITTGVLQNGTGVFDKLIHTEQLRLDQQWKQNRITGSDYTKVYLGSLETIMQQSIIFLLGRQEADKKAEAIDKDIEKTDAELLLIAQQVETEKCRTTLTCNQAAKVLKDIELVDEEILQTAEQTKLITAQTAKTYKETELLDEQILLAQAEVALKEKQLEIAEQELYLMRAKAWVEIARVSDDVSITQPPATITGLMGNEIEKMGAEADLMRQRYISEQAQTTDTTSGLLGKQQTVLVKQAEGFDRNAEQQAAKILTDTFSVQKTADDSVLTPAGLTNAEITKVLDALKQGIGLSSAPPCPVVECPDTPD